jgi:omega-amidase
LSAPLTVAACQALTYPQPQRSASAVIDWMERAAAQGIDVVAFPEACLCGYACDPAYWERAEPADFAAAEGRVLEAARRLDLAVILGTVHWEGGERFNSLLVIDKGGVVHGRYAKTHLAESWSTPGRRLLVYAVAGVPSCFLVCHDIRYPELVRLPAIAGAQICYFCSCESGLLAEYKLSAYRCMPVARAAENDIYLVMANAPADPQHMDSPSQSHGNSKIIDPDGNVLDEAGLFEERLVVRTIDVDAARRRYARRAVEDDTLLRDWLRQGAGLVDVQGTEAGRWPQ